MRFKIVASVMFAGIFILRIYKPELNIDQISIVLLILAFLPWFIQYIKSLEIHGIGKVELISEGLKNELEMKAKELGFLEESFSKSNDTKYSFYSLRYEDIKLALAGLRIELESTLKKIVEQNNLAINNFGIKNTINILIQNELITNNEKAIIDDIILILNKAVHDDLGQYNNETFDWVFDLGLNLLESLNQKLR